MIQGKIVVWPHVCGSHMQIYVYVLHYIFQTISLYSRFNNFSSKPLCITIVADLYVRLLDKF